MPQRYAKRSRENPIYELPESAIKIVARSAGCSRQEARKILKDLVKSGYFVAPREPSNSMLRAYIISYGMLPQNVSTVITAIGKARKRWIAMGSAGTAIALSLYPLRDGSEKPDIIAEIEDNQKSDGDAS